MPGFDEDDSPWADSPDPTASQSSTNDHEWDRLASQYTTAGYREGITAGKEASLQEGFDCDFAAVGAPLGRRIGRMRGVLSALQAILSDSRQPLHSNPTLLEDVRNLGTEISRLQLEDIAPPDLEAEQHAKEHLEADPDAAGNDEGRRLDSLLREAERRKSNTDRVALVEDRLKELLGKLGMAVSMD